MLFSFNPFSKIPVALLITAFYLLYSICSYPSLITVFKNHSTFYFIMFIILLYKIGKDTKKVVYKLFLFSIENSKIIESVLMNSF